MTLIGSIMITMSILLIINKKMKRKKIDPVYSSSIN